MSRLTVAAGVTIAMVALARPARAEAIAKTAPAPSSLRWDLDARLGYATSWTTAQPYLGMGTGLAGGLTFRVPIHVELSMMYHAGSTVSAANQTISYWSRAWSLLAHAGAGYEFAMFAKHFVVRPQAIVGCAFVSETVRVGGAVQRGVDPLFTVGPGAAFLVRFGGLHAGVDARALFVPSRVAAPIGGIYGVFGFER